MSQVLTRDQLAAMDVDALLNLGFDQIAMVEGYKPLPTALYNIELVSAGMEAVGADETPAVVFGLKVHEVVEFDKKEDEATFDVSKLPLDYKENFFLTKKDGSVSTYSVEMIRTVFGPVSEQLGLNSTKDLIEYINANPGTMVQGIIKHRVYKNKDTAELKESNQLDLTGLSLLG